MSTNETNVPTAQDVKPAPKTGFAAPNFTSEEQQRHPPIPSNPLGDRSYTPRYRRHRRPHQQPREIRKNIYRSLHPQKQSLLEAYHILKYRMENQE